MSFLSSIYASGEQERSDDLDRRRQELEQRRADLGLQTQAQAEQRKQQIASERLDVAGDLNEAFVEGAKEGLASEQSFIKKAIDAPIDFIFGALSWKVLLIAGVALFLYLGGGVYLRGIIPKLAKK